MRVRHAGAPPDDGAASTSASSPTLVARIFPEERRFLPEVAELAETAVEAARALAAAVAGTQTDEGLPRRSRYRLATEIVNDVELALPGTLVTPVDREDVHALAVGFRDVIRSIDRTARLHDIVHCRRPSGPGLGARATILVDLLMSAVQSVEWAIACVRDGPRALIHARETRKTRAEADRALVRISADLLDGRSPPLEVLCSIVYCRAIVDAMRVATRIATRIECIALKRF